MLYKVSLIKINTVEAAYAYWDPFGTQKNWFRYLTDKKSKWALMYISYERVIWDLPIETLLTEY